MLKMTSGNELIKTFRCETYNRLSKEVWLQVTRLKIDL